MPQRSPTRASRSIGERYAPAHGPQITPQRSMIGDTRYVGDGLHRGDHPAATPAQNVTIAVVEPFGCTFQEKTENAEAKGYTGVIIFSPQLRELRPLVQHADQHAVHRTTPATPSRCSCRARSASGSWASTTRDVPLRRHEPDADADRGRSRAIPVNISTAFDGWGYTHLYSNDGDDLERDRPLRDRGGDGRAVRDRLRRPHRARVRHRPDREPRLQLVLRGAACA